MTREATALLDEALKLSAEERAGLAARLLRSLDDDEGDEAFDQAAYDDAWGAEVEKRAGEVARGEVRPVPWDEARKRIATDE